MCRANPRMCFIYPDVLKAQIKVEDKNTRREKMRRLFAITFLALFAFTGTAFAEIGFKWKSKITGVKCSKKCKTKCKNYRVKRCRLYKKYVKLSLIHI